MLVLILRSAHTEVLPQTRTRVRASRRMRTRGARALMLRDASQRGSDVEAPVLAARCDAPQHEGRSGRCILAKRPSAGFGENEPNGVRVVGPGEEPTCGCRKRAPRRAPCFRPVLYRGLRNSSV